ncbi:MAG: O-antigen ligase family protein [Anaerolineae bacterium]|nr:O-antigen ligase family protein [Anaerolineae bacterium]
MLETKPPAQLTSLQANLISLFLVGIGVSVLLVLSVGYRHTAVGILALAGLLAVSLGVAILMRPQLGAYILVLSVFTNVSSILTDQGWPGINKPLIVLVFLSILAHRLLAGKSLLPLKWTERFMLAYGAAWLASTFIAQDQDLAFEQVVNFGKDFVILLCVLYPLAAQPHSWKRAIWLITIAATVLAALGAYQALTGNTDQTFWGFSKFIQGQIVAGAEDRGRLSGPLDDPNFYGQILVAVLPLALYRLLDERQLLVKSFAGLSFILLIFGVLNTYSRGAFLALLVILFLIALERRVNLSLLLLIILTTLLLRQFLPTGFTDRLETLFIFTDEETTVHSDVSFRGRSSEVQTGLNMFTDHPFLGVGVGNYPVFYQEYASRLGLEQRTSDRKAHSLYVEIAAETGMFGLVTFGGVFVSLLTGLVQARRKLKALAEYPQWAGWITSVQMSIIAYLISSFFLHGDYLRYLWLLVALGVALIHLADHLSKKAQSQSVEGGLAVA